MHDEGKRLRAPKVLKVGSDFTGLDAPRVALSRMLGPDKVTHLFSSDQAIECQAVLKGRESHGVVYGDVLAQTADQEAMLTCTHGRLCARAIRLLVKEVE